MEREGGRRGEKREGGNKIRKECKCYGSYFSHLYSSAHNSNTLSISIIN